MKLVPVDGNYEAHLVLYQLLQERPRESWVTHKSMPTFEEHQRFVRSGPFLWWYVIEVGGGYIGAIEATDRNKVGVYILRKFRRKGYGGKALRLFFDTHKPLPAIPAIRNGHWLANIAVLNEDSKAFFRKMGFSPLQETWVLP